MKNPQIKSKINGYCFEWEDSSLSCLISRLNVHGDGRVTGDLEIGNGNKDHPLILMPSSQFNFSAERTRAQTAKQLKEKYPGKEIDWIELFDYLGYKVQELARAGEPVEEIWATEDVVPPEILVNPIMIKGVSNIIFGEKGVNKSTLCYAIGGLLVLAKPENILNLTVPERVVQTLVLDWENDRYIFNYYLSRLMKGTFNNNTFPLHYRRCNLPLVEELEPIEKYIQDHKIEVIIIDSLAAAAGGENSELKGSQASLQFNAALRKLNITSLIIAQTNKDQQTNKKTIYGSTLFTYYARNIFELCSAEEDSGDIIHLGLFHRECNLAKKHSPMGFVVNFNDAKQSITIQSEKINLSQFARKVTTSYRILEVLKNGAMTTKDIASALNMKAPTIAVIIQRLKRSGKVVQVGDGWGLLSSFSE